MCLLFPRTTLRIPRALDLTSPMFSGVKLNDLQVKSELVSRLIKQPLSPRLHSHVPPTSGFVPFSRFSFSSFSPHCALDCLVDSHAHHRHHRRFITVHSVQNCESPKETCVKGFEVETGGLLPTEPTANRVILLKPKRTSLVTIRPSRHRMHENTSVLPKSTV